MKKVIIIGTGLGGLATALRLTTYGYDVEMVESYHKPGGRLNRLEKDGFVFDLGPTIFSMSYEFDELFKTCQVKNPLSIFALEPLYRVFFESGRNPLTVYRDPHRLANEFSSFEPDFLKKFENYLKDAALLFRDTQFRILKQNFNSRLDYLIKMLSVPLRHTPKMLRTLWQELSRNFVSNEVRIILSLVGFFLGGTPFDTPAIYKILSYTEFQFDGYYRVKGGMYQIVEQLVELLKKRNVQFHYNTKIIKMNGQQSRVCSMLDDQGRKWESDLFVCNADAAGFRQKVLQRNKYNPQYLDKKKWGMAPFTIYLGVKGKIPNLEHHNYFLGKNFEQYTRNIFKNNISPQKPYYYVNCVTKFHPEFAPSGCEGLFILCPVPDLRYKAQWSDSEVLAKEIIQDLSLRLDYDLFANRIMLQIMNPLDWQAAFSLYRGSGLGLNHNLSQVGGFRPPNKDEEYCNLYYVGASTIPGTGLPMVIISSKLVTERILQDDPDFSKSQHRMQPDSDSAL